MSELLIPANKITKFFSVMANILHVSPSALWRASPAEVRAAWERWRQYCTVREANEAREALGTLLCLEEPVE